MRFLLFLAAAVAAAVVVGKLVAGLAATQSAELRRSIDARQARMETQAGLR